MLHYVDPAMKHLAFTALLYAPKNEVKSKFLLARYEVSTII